MPPNANGGRTEAMHLIEELENRLALSSMNVPAVISAARIAVVYHDHAVARGVVERLQDDLSHILQQAQPLFKAGFAATDPVAGQAIAVSVGGQAGQLIITEGSQRARPGQPVTPRLQEAPPSGAVPANATRGG